MLRLLPQMIGTFGLGLPRALAMQGVLEKHHPHPPHWYLQFVGCEPAAQGKGHGGAANRARLAQCDEQGLPAALETATPGNLGLYQTLGFVVTDSYTINNGPDFWTMWREPR
ncbi:MAG: GNAT family N-acetyltransferase [Sandarakinorhabdus sp.]|nr:GNAT family N-acetyltransferase [Sandarakinorhabdus sp.]